MGEDLQRFCDRRFEFFHKVRQLRLSDDRQSVAALEMDVQATLKGRSEGAQYQPLIDVKGLPAWPGQPLFDQLEQGDALREQDIDLESWWGPWQAVGRRTLRAGEDFDRSPPGSTRYRLKAWGSGYANLVLAGDWIYTGLNVGSVEDTVMSGKLTSHAISGSPALASIVGYPASREKPEP